MDDLLLQAETFLASVKSGIDYRGDQDLKDRINKFEQKKIDLRYLEINANLNYSDYDIKRFDGKFRDLAENLKKAMNFNLDPDNQSGYTVTYLLTALRDYREYSQNFEQAKKNNAELNIVKDQFGDVAFSKRFVRKNDMVTAPKTSQELTDERNERLAILNQRKGEGKISEEEFMKAVISTRRVYQRAIEKSLQGALEHVVPLKLTLKEKLTNSLKDSVGAIVSKLSEVLHFNLKTDKSETQEQSVDYKKYLINKNAMQALGSVADIIVENKDCTEDAVKEELFNIDNTIIEIGKTQQEEYVVVPKIASEILKLKLNSSNEEIKEHYRKQVFSFGSPTITNFKGQVVPNEDLSYQRDAYIKYMHDNNEIYYDVPSTGVPIERFKDKAVEEEYKKTLEKFEQSKKFVEELMKHKNYLPDMDAEHETQKNL